MGKAMNRSCGWCDKAIYYGLFCSNECSDKDYGLWQLLRKEDHDRSSRS